MKEKKIGIVGLGRMGANMARRMKDCGYTISCVYDILDSAAEELAKELSTKKASTLSQVTSLSDIVITVVTNDKAMDTIYHGENNLFENAQGKIFINCATLHPNVHIELEKEAMAKGARTLEACMASSIPQARNGELYLMIGGDESLFLELKSLLDDLSKNLLYIGKAGKAAQVKALVNMVMNMNTAALAEGLGIADALGLDLNTVCKVFSQTGANSRVLETDSEDMIKRDHDCFFSAEHAAKDSGIAIDIAKEVGINTPLADATLAQYNKMVELGLGDLDKSGIAELTFKGRKG